MTKQNVRYGVAARKPIIHLLDRVRELFEYDDGKLIRRVRPKQTSVRIGDRAGCLKPGGYRQVYVGGILYQEHRIIWLHVHGEEPPETIDHINGVRDDNRIENLRAIEQSHNVRRAARGKGYSWYKITSSWQAAPRYNGKQYHLGYFKHEADAIAAVAEFRAKNNVVYD